MSVVILVPVLRRPRNVRPLLKSIHDNTPEPHRVLFICSPGDEAEILAVERSGEDFIVMDRCYEGRGEYARKINEGYLQSDDPLIFLGADDLFFHPNWLENAKKKLRKGIGVIGTNDAHNPEVLKGIHATHSLVIREYVEKHGTIDVPNRILCDLYPHEWVDNELIGTAKMRKAWAFAKDSVIEHLHPNFGLADWDDLYTAQPWRMAHGKRIFDRRKRLWAVT